MIDPHSITKFDRSLDELQEFIIFAVLVAGKTAKTVAKQLDTILANKKDGQTVFEHFASVDIPQLLKANGVGCYNQKGKTIQMLIDAYNQKEICLYTSGPDDLEKITGIGPKTSRFFILHSRPRQQVAVLDTHILKAMRSWGYDTPKSTPGKGKAYKNLEIAFLEECKKLKIEPATFDLILWKIHASQGKVEAKA